MLGRGKVGAYFGGGQAWGHNLGWDPGFGTPPLTRVSRTVSRPGVQNVSETVLENIESPETQKRLLGVSADSFQIVSGACWPPVLEGPGRLSQRLFGNFGLVRGEGSPNPRYFFFGVEESSRA